MLVNQSELGQADFTGYTLPRTATAANALTLATFERRVDDPPRNMCLLVETYKSAIAGATLNEARELRPCAGLAGLQHAHNCIALRVHYGAGGDEASDYTPGAGGPGARILVADARSGCYQLPPSDFCKVEVFAWDLRPAGSWTVDAHVRVRLVEGTTPRPSRFTVTAGFSLAAAGSQALGQVPDGARWVDVWADYAAPGAGAPIVQLHTGGGVPLLERDYLNYRHTPGPGPQEIATHGTPTLKNAGANTATCWVQYYLDP